MTDLYIEDAYKDFEKDIEDFNQGRISYEEIKKRGYIRQRERFAPILLKHYKKSEWKDFISLALAVYEVMPLAFRFFDEVPDDMKYDFAINAYTHHGDSIPAVRKAVRMARRYGKPDLPDELSKLDKITIYRAGEEPIDKCKYRISWTTNREVAEFFLNQYIHRHATHLYKGKIKPADIIAYMDDRNEQEVMQYGKVYDITEITEDTAGKRIL